MNIKSNEKKENSAVELVIEVGAEQFESALNKVYQKKRKNIALPGFRRGKATRKMVEAMYGAQVFYQDAIDMLYPEAYTDALKETGLEPVAPPELAIQSMGPEGFTFKAVVTVEPETVIRGYQGLTAPKKEATVTDEDVEKMLQTYVDQASRLVTVEREAANGDTVELDFKGYKDGEPFEGGEGENYSLELGSGDFIPGFEDQLVGVRAGEAREVHVTFPEDYQEAKLAGCEAVFQVTVHGVKERLRPEVDDDFAKDVSEFDTLEEFKKDLREKMREQRQKTAQEEFESALLTELAKRLECELPEPMVEYQIDLLMEDFNRRLRYQGFTMESYLAVSGSTAADMRRDFRESAESVLRTDLAIKAVAREENIQVTDEEKNAEVDRLAQENGISADRVRQSVGDGELEYTLRRRKVLDLLLTTAHAVPPEQAGEGEQPAEPEPPAEAPQE